MPPLRPHEVGHVGQPDEACDTRGGRGLTLPPGDKLVAPVVVIAHKRPDYLAKAMVSLLRWAAAAAEQGGGMPPGKQDGRLHWACGVSARRRATRIPGPRPAPSHALHSRVLGTGWRTLRTANAFLCLSALTVRTGRRYCWPRRSS